MNPADTGISFNKIHIKKIDLESRADGVFPKGGVQASVGFGITANIIDGKKAVLDIEVSLEGDKNADAFPFKKFSLLIAGEFSLTGEKDRKKITDFSKIQAPALMFPFIRETLATLTQRAGFPPFLLPPIVIKALIGGGKKTSPKKTKKIK